MKKLSFILMVLAVFCLISCGNNQGKKAVKEEAKTEVKDACCGGHDDDTSDDDHGCGGDCGDNCKK